MADTVGKKQGARAIFRYAWGSWGLFVVAVVTAALATVFSSLTPQVIKITVDSVLGDKPLELPPLLEGPVAAMGVPLDNLVLPALALLALAVLSGVCTFLSRTSAARASQGMIRRLREALYLHTQRLPYSWQAHHQTGDIIQRCTSDVEVVQKFVSNQFLEVFRTSFLILFAMWLMFGMNRKLTWIALLYLPVIVGYSWVYYGRIAHRFHRADEAEGALSAAVQENLTGVRVVRAFGREAYEIHRFDEKNIHFSNLWINLGYTLGSYWALGDLITSLQIVTVIVLGSIEAVSGAITLGEFIAFVSYNSTLIWPIRGLGRILSEMSKAGVSMSRLAYLLEAPEEGDSPEAIAPDIAGDTGLGDIVFDHVTFGYSPDNPVLKDVSFTIPAGKTFAILGGTGSGKSTLMHLLLRLYDLPEGGGSITVGRVDIRRIRRAHLRRNIGIVLQEPFLFSRTVGENIAIAHPEAPMEEVRRAANLACVDEAIEGFPQGYDTVVGERGVTLSGGQKQRVAIARMLMQKAPVMIFDDSLSAVDSETDSKIRLALREQVGGSTLVLISHRITTLMQADVILVLEEGRVAQMGSHEALLGEEGIYKEIYDIQMSSDDRRFVEGGDSQWQHPRTPRTANP